MVILHADDDKDDRDLFEEIVKQIDPLLTLVQAKDGSEALRVLSESTDRPPEIIFLDINMPVMDGFETLVEIRREKKYRHTKIILYSTGILPRMQESYASYNIRFLKKSNNFKDSLETIRSVIMES